MKKLLTLFMLLAVVGSVVFAQGEKKSDLSAALGAALTAMAMWYVDRRQGYGLQLPNIRK